MVGQKSVTDGPTVKRTTKRNLESRSAQLKISSTNKMTLPSLCSEWDGNISYRAQTQAHCAKTNLDVTDDESSSLSDANRKTTRCDIVSRINFLINGTGVIMSFCSTSQTQKILRPFVRALQWRHSVCWLLCTMKFRHHNEIFVRFSVKLDFSLFLFFQFFEVWRRWRSID